MATKNHSCKIHFKRSRSCSGLRSYSQFKTALTRTANDPDPNLMAPLLVGDYVALNGIELGDLLAVHTLIANIGLYTAPREQRKFSTCVILDRYKTNAT